VTTGLPLRIEDYLPALDRHFDISAYAVGDDCFVAVFDDVSARRRAEARLRQLNAELEERVALRTAALDALNRDLESFSYSVSHDLRAPLRIIDGFSQAVLEDHGERLPAEGRRQLEAIRRGAARMGQLIDALLELSRLGRAPLRARRVDMAALVDDALEDLADLRAGRDLSVRIGALPPCEGDPTLLKQVWTNLLGNALKYTAGRPAAVVEVGARNEGGDALYFVRDNGAGFDMAQANRLFQVFQRLHPDREFAGTGVGLAIVQHIIQRHGGRVWAEAAVDRGATFFFTLAQAGHRQGSD
jgi:light-regulated signal transduction histidine kinase (bacteriophytochrome)